MSVTQTSAAVGAPVTSGGFNAVLQALNPPIVRLTTTVAQSTSATANTNTAVQWNQETYDDSNTHDNVTNNSRITIPSGWGGYYYFRANIRTAAGAVNTTITQFAVNGVIQTASAIPNQASTTLGAFCAISDTYLLSPGDYVEVFIQNTGTSVAVTIANCFVSAAFAHP